MSKIFDKDAVLERCDNDSELVKELIDLFITDYPRAISEIERAVKSGDSSAIGRTSHSIKSALGNLGAMIAYHVAYDIELSAKKGELDDIKNKYELLVQSVSDFFNAWEKEKSTI